MIRRILFSIFSFFSILIQAQEIFPEISCSNLNDKSIVIPKNTKGKVTILALAYSKEAENDLKTWLQPAYDKFINQNQAMPYDVNLFFIPMFTGAKAASANSAKEKIKKETDPELHPYILIYKGELEKYKSALGMDKKDTPYFFILDENGKIIYKTSGAYSDEKMDELEDNI